VQLNFFQLNHLQILWGFTNANYARLSITGEYLILANRLFGLMEFDGPISNNTKADRPIQKEKKIVSISFPFITLCLDFKWLAF